MDDIVLHSLEPTLAVDVVVIFSVLFEHRQVDFDPGIILLLGDPLRKVVEVDLGGILRSRLSKPAILGLQCLFLGLLLPIDSVDDCIFNFVDVDAAT